MLVCFFVYGDDEDFSGQRRHDLHGPEVCGDVLIKRESQPARDPRNKGIIEAHGADVEPHKSQHGIFPGPIRVAPRSGSFLLSRLDPGNIAASRFRIIFHPMLFSLLEPGLELVVA